MGHSGGGLGLQWVFPPSVFSQVCLAFSSEGRLRTQKVLVLVSQAQAGAICTTSELNDGLQRHPRYNLQKP